MLELTSERLRNPLISTPIQQATGIYLVKIGDRTLYIERNFNPNQSWLNDSDYHKLMGWDQIQVQFLPCSPTQTSNSKEAVLNSIDIF